MLNTLDKFLDGLSSVNLNVDPLLCQEVRYRYFALQGEIRGLPSELRPVAAALVEDLLPSDWPLWMEIGSAWAPTHH